MAETKQPIAPLAGVDKKEDFVVTKSGVAFIFRGAKVDLRKIDRATAEALANNPGCRFLQWAPGKGADAQKAPGKDK